MYFPNKSSRLAGIAGSALLLALFVPSPALAVQDAGGPVMETSTNEGNQVVSCERTDGTEATAASEATELDDPRLPVLVAPGEGGKTLLHRK